MPDRSPGELRTTPGPARPAPPSAFLLAPFVLAVALLATTACGAGGNTGGNPTEDTDTGATGTTDVRGDNEGSRVPPEDIGVPPLRTDFGVVFPTRYVSEYETQPEAAGAGVLVVDEQGCLRAERPSGGNYVLIWPFDYELTARGGELLVLDGSTGEEVGKVGEEVQFGGAGGEPVAPSGGRPVPEPVRELQERCPGPTWTVTEAGYDLAEEARQDRQKNKAAMKEDREKNKAAKEKAEEPG